VARLLGVRPPVRAHREPADPIINIVHSSI
jgi:hypothetical protein